MAQSAAPQNLDYLFQANPAGAIEVAYPVVVIKIIDAHFFSATRGVDELIVAQINADVRKGAAHRVEEDQVAGLQIIFDNRLPFLAHGLGGAWQRQTEAHPENMGDEAGTIKTQARVAATPLIRHAEQVGGLIKDILHRGRCAVDKGNAQRWLDNNWRLDNNRLFCQSRWRPQQREQHQEGCGENEKWAVKRHGRTIAAMG